MVLKTRRLKRSIWQHADRYFRESLSIINDVKIFNCGFFEVYFMYSESDGGLIGNTFTKPLIQSLYYNPFNTVPLIQSLYYNPFISYENLLVLLVSIYIKL